MQENPAALDAGAPTSLGVLYYRVPGFPFGFGDNDKARQLLAQAVLARAKRHGRQLFLCRFSDGPA